MAYAIGVGVAFIWGFLRWILFFAVIIFVLFLIFLFVVRPVFHWTTGMWCAQGLPPCATLVIPPGPTTPAPGTPPQPGGPTGGNTGTRTTSSGNVPLTVNDVVKLVGGDAANWKIYAQDSSGRINAWHYFSATPVVMTVPPGAEIDHPGGKSYSGTVQTAVATLWFPIDPIGDPTRLDPTRPRGGAPAAQPVAGAPQQISNQQTSGKPTSATQVAQLVGGNASNWSQLPGYDNGWKYKGPSVSLKVPEGFVLDHPGGRINPGQSATAPEATAWYVAQ